MNLKSSTISLACEFAYPCPITPPWGGLLCLLRKRYELNFLSIHMNFRHRASSTALRLDFPSLRSLILQNEPRKRKRRFLPVTPYQHKQLKSFKGIRNCLRNSLGLTNVQRQQLSDYLHQTFVQRHAPAVYCLRHLAQRLRTALHITFFYPLRMSSSQLMN